MGRLRSGRTTRDLVLALLASAGLTTADHAVAAAEVRVRMPVGCGQRADIVGQVETLLGRPLATLTGVDFEVDIRPSEGSRWRMRLDTVEVVPASRAATGVRRTRELSAATCAELTDAAATAIALTVRSIDRDRDREDDREAATAATRRPPPASATTPDATRAAAPATALVRVAPAEAPVARERAALAVGAFGDTGSLPGASVGLELSGWIRMRGVRLVASGVLLAPREKRLSAGGGGDFQLALGALEVCAPRAWRRSTLIACGGIELGYLWAEGIGVTYPRQGGAVWEAARADVGLSIPLAARLAVVVRAGAAAPLSRPRFALEGTTPLHRPGRVAGRGAVAFELGF